MLEKLRRKFIFTIMLMVTITLVVMSGVILAINYGQNKATLYQAVQYATTDTAFEHHDGGDQISDGTVPPASDQGLQTDTSAATPADGGNGSIGGQGGANKGGGMIATSCYLVSSDGSITSTLTNALELDSSTASQAVATALAHYNADAAEGVTGSIGELNMFYSIRHTPSGIKVAVASDSYLTNGVTSLGQVLGLVCACVWLAFFGISIFLARWVVRPTERAWKQQQQFVADASHELKTPLTVIMANNSILLGHEDETVASQRRWVESSQSEAHQMLSLVNDMLFLAKPENQNRQIVTEDIDFSDLVEGDVLQFESVCFEKDIDLKDAVGKNVVVRGDKARLQRLVSTLLDNACKYADEGGWVKVSLEKHGSQAVFTVNNDGTVIPPEDIPHIFDRFYRVDKARVRSEGGFGLGLAIAKEVVDEHHGTIEVTSDEQRGTLFTVTLPLTKD